METFNRPAQLKLERARVHATELTQSIKNWGENPSMRTSGKIDTDRLGYKITFEGFEVPPPLHEWGLLLGDCIHNLRTALDTLAFGLARLKCDPPEDPDDVHLPIAQSLNDFNAKPLSPFPNEVTPVLESLQPYHYPPTEDGGATNTHAIRLLNRLSNDDKHRIPTVVSISRCDKVNLPIEIQFFDPDMAALEKIPWEIDVPPTALIPGATLLTLRTPCRIEKVIGGWSGTAYIAIETKFGKGPAEQVLDYMCMYCERFVYQFEKFFEADRK